MGFVEFLTSIFGNKSQRDMKAVQPYVEKIKALYDSIDCLSNDELRARSAALMQQIADAVAPMKQQIVDLKATVEQIDIDKREDVYHEVDKLEKDIKSKYEEVLNEILSEVFAIVKSTARRFAGNESIEVTATQFDRDLAARQHDFIEINGDKAIYHNHWMAGGN